MNDYAPRRAGPLWVWLLGLLVLVMGILFLVRWAGEREAATTGPAAPAAAEQTDLQAEAEPAQRDSAITDVERTSVPIALSAIVPLGPAHTGVHATFEGRVVGEEVDGGAWVRTDDGTTIFLRIVDAEDAPAAGERLAGRGIVRHDPQRVRAWLRSAEIGAGRPAGLVTDYYLETTRDRLGAPRGD